MIRDELKLGGTQYPGPCAPVVARSARCTGYDSSHFGSSWAAQIKFCKGSLEAAAGKGPGLGSLVSLGCVALPIVAGARKWMGSEPASEPESSVSSESLISRHLFATSNRVAAIQEELAFCQERVQNLEVQLRSLERDHAVVV